jgi:SAM-dependent methyltransferase
MTTAPDGSPVALYLRLPPLGEAERIDELLPERAPVLELGCGVGRVTHELVRLGHVVTAVDESAAMLAHVRGTQTVQSRIEELRLGRRFPCVLLMSNLVNVPDDAQRRAFLRTCADHVTDEGVVVIERHEPDWRPQDGFRGERDGVTFSLEQIRLEPRVVAGTVRYEADGLTWRHAFVARLLDDDELEAELRLVGLQLAGVHCGGTWVEARPLYSGA